MATFGGASGKSRRRRTDTPSAHVPRIGWILLRETYQNVWKCVHVISLSVDDVAVPTGVLAGQSQP
jgi:hypothetical protein